MKTAEQLRVTGEEEIHNAPAGFRGPGRPRHPWHVCHVSMADGPATYRVAVDLTGCPLERTAVFTAPGGSVGAAWTEKATVNNVTVRRVGNGMVAVYPTDPAKPARYAAASGDARTGECGQRYDYVP